MMERKCLKCDKMFDSSGPGNRICGICQDKNNKEPKVAIHTINPIIEYRHIKGLK
jgi:hypothetical protein